MSLLFVTVLGCQSFTGFDFDSEAIAGGGAVAGKDYITGLQPSSRAREYFAKSNASSSQKVTVTRGDDKGTGVVWTDDGGIVIPPGCSIEFENKGYCMDPHLPAPKAGEEMQFVKTSSLIPDELQGTYRNLLKRSAAGDEDVKNNMQRLVWALRTAGSQDAMATHLTDRQREILSECAENGSFEDYVYRHEMYGKIVEELKSKFINKIKDSTSVKVGDIVYDAFDLLDPDKTKQKVSSHLDSLIRMNLNLPVTKSGFNFGELTNGIYTDIKGNGTLSFKAKIANSTSQPYTFYPMDYVAQVGSGGSSVGFYAAANSGMKQRTTTDVPEEGEVEKRDWYVRNEVFDWKPLSCTERSRLFQFALMSEASYKYDIRDELERGVEGVITDLPYDWIYRRIGAAEIDMRLPTIISETLQDLDSRIQFNLFETREGEIVLAFRGTDEFKDVYDDLNLVIDDTKQSEVARKIVRAVADYSPVPIIVVGHSLGGYLAVSSTIGNDGKVKEVYTFNSPGLDVSVHNRYSEEQKKRLSSKTVNTWHSLDVVHLGNNVLLGDSHLGKKVEINGYAGYNDAWLSESHLLDIFLPGRSAIAYNHGIDVLIMRMGANMADCGW